MRQRVLPVLLMLTVAAGLVACDAAGVAVFSAPSAGSAGVAGGAGSAGSAGSMGGTAGATSLGDGASAGQGGDASAGETVCHGDGDCPPDTFFCQTRTCEPGAPGVCVVKQPVCDSDLKPVCGCDHLTYWNDCLRQQYGIQATSSERPCSTGARTCRGNNECPGMFGATCSRLLTPGIDCGPSMDLGTCWVTPSDCASTSDSGRWQSCPPPNSGGALGPCTSTCAAIKIGHPFIPAPSATCP